MRIEPMKTLGPAWQIVDHLGVEYVLWAPREDESEFGGPTSRTYWQAQWCDEKYVDGDLRTSENVDEVLVIFPVRVAAMFRPVIDDHVFGARGEQWRLGELVS